MEMRNLVTIDVFVRLFIYCHRRRFVCSMERENEHFYSRLNALPANRLVISIFFPLYLPFINRMKSITLKMYFFSFNFPYDKNHLYYLMTRAVAATSATLTAIAAKSARFV